MIVIYAEKADVGNKLAAALGGFELPDGTRITYRNLKAKEKEVKKLQSKQGYLDTIFKGNPCKVTWGYGHMYPDDAAEAVDQMLHSISQGDMAAVTYYHNGEYVRATGIISKLDMQKKKLSIVNTEILFSDIYEIQKE